MNRDSCRGSRRRQRLESFVSSRLVGVGVGDADGVALTHTRRAAVQGARRSGRAPRRLVVRGRRRRLCPTTTNPKTAPANFHPLYLCSPLNRGSRTRLIVNIACRVFLFNGSMAAP